RWSWSQIPNRVNPRATCWNESESRESPILGISQRGRGRGLEMRIVLGRLFTSSTLRHQPSTAASGRSIGQLSWFYRATSKYVEVAPALPLHPPPPLILS